MPDDLWMEVHDIVQEKGNKTIPKKKKCWMQSIDYYENKKLLITFVVRDPLHFYVIIFRNPARFT